MNHQIRALEVRVIGADNTQLGILPVEEALETAYRLGLDLVEVSPQVRPPVCKIMDYGKFKYEQKKKAQEARKKATVVLVKEVKFRPRTERHDLETKAKHILRFLSEGNRARVLVVFRGREMAHPEIGQRLVEQLLQYLGEAAIVDSPPRMEGRMLGFQLSPGKAEALREATAKVGELKPLVDDIGDE